MQYTSNTPSIFHKGLPYHRSFILYKMQVLYLLYTETEASVDGTVENIKKTVQK